MNHSEERKMKVAILDMNEGLENQGMRCIRSIVSNWAEQNNIDITIKEYNVRQHNDIPDVEHDIYISSGGPGSPLKDEKNKWEKKYFGWVRKMEKWNETEYPKKHVFFICHSFQLVCRYYNLGLVKERKSTSFGVFPIPVLDDSYAEPIFEGLANPFFAVDSRSYQVIQPNFEKIRSMGGKILALEKLRPHVQLERAIMAIRINDYFIGTQFHPEADAEGMRKLLQREDKKQTVIANFSQQKWEDMMEQLGDPKKISYTYSHILPNFLNYASEDLVMA